MLLYKWNNHSINRNVFPFFFGLIFFLLASLSNMWQQHVSNTLDPKYKVQVDTHMWPCALIDNGNIKHDNIKHQNGNLFPTLQLGLKVPVKCCKQSHIYIERDIYKTSLALFVVHPLVELTCTDPRQWFSQEIQHQCFLGSTGKLLNLLDPSRLCRALPIINAIPFSHSSDTFSDFLLLSCPTSLSWPEEGVFSGVEDWRATEDAQGQWPASAQASWFWARECPHSFVFLQWSLQSTGL